MTPPNKIYLYRMVHWENVEYALKYGLCCREHELADPAYINIGHLKLIADRHNYSIPLPDGGHLGEYIPFYFAGHSPMLLMIKNGTPPVTQRVQEEIVFLVSTLEKVKQANLNYCFTDKHAKRELANFYVNDEDLDKIDWKVVQSKQWSNIPEYRDRQDRKQAEFLVRNYMPVSCIAGLIVKSVEKKEYFENIIANLHLDLKVHADKKGQYYY